MTICWQPEEAEEATFVNNKEVSMLIDIWLPQSRSSSAEFYICFCLCKFWSTKTEEVDNISYNSKET